MDHALTTTKLIRTNVIQSDADTNRNSYTSSTAGQCNRPTHREHLRSDRADVQRVDCQVPDNIQVSVTDISTCVTRDDIPHQDPAATNTDCVTSARRGDTDRSCQTK